MEQLHTQLQLVINISLLGGTSGNYLGYGGSGGTANWIAPATSISSTSTNLKIPSAKAVYDYVQDSISGITGVEFEVVQSLPQTRRIWSYLFNLK